MSPNPLINFLDAFEKKFCSKQEYWLEYSNPISNESIQQWFLKFYIIFLGLRTSSGSQKGLDHTDEPAKEQTSTLEKSEQDIVADSGSCTFRAKGGVVSKM